MATSNQFTVWDKQNSCFTRQGMTIQKEPTLLISAAKSTSGGMRLNYAATKALGLNQGDQIIILEGLQINDWFLCKVKKGGITINFNKEAKDKGVYIGMRKLGQHILLKTGASASMRVRIGTVAETLPKMGEGMPAAGFRIYMNEAK